MMNRQIQRMRAWFKSKVRRRPARAMDAAASGGGNDTGTSQVRPDMPSGFRRITQKLAQPRSRAWLRALTFLFLLAAAYGLWQGTRINRLTDDPLVLTPGSGVENMADTTELPLGYVADLAPRLESVFDPPLSSLTLPEVVFPDGRGRDVDVGEAVAEPAVVASPLPEILDLSQVIWPVVGVVAGGYGWHRDPVTNDWQFQAGLRIEPEREAAPVRASLPGIVQTINTSGNGYRIVMAHAEGWSTEYVGLSSLDVAEGQSVAAGDRIGDLTVAPHRSGLYFVMRDASGPVNPTEVLYTPPR